MQSTPGAASAPLSENASSSRSTLTWWRSEMNFSVLFSFATRRTYAFQRLCHVYCYGLDIYPCPALCPGRALLVRIPLGHRPWLRQLRCRLLRFVRRLQCYYGDVRLPAFVRHRLRLLTFPMRTLVQGSTLAKRGTSQLPVRSLCA